MRAKSENRPYLALVAGLTIRAVHGQSVVFSRLSTLQERKRMLAPRVQLAEESRFMTTSGTLDTGSP